MPCLYQRRVLTLSYKACYLVLHASYIGISHQHSISILTCAYEFLRYFIGHFSGIMESKWTATWKEKKQTDTDCRYFFLTVVFIVPPPSLSLSLSVSLIPFVKRGLFLSSGGRIWKQNGHTPLGLVAEWISISGPGVEARFVHWWASDVRSWSTVQIICRVIVLRMTHVAVPNTPKTDIYLNSIKTNSVPSPEKTVLVH